MFLPPDLAKLQEVHHPGLHPAHLSAVPRPADLHAARSAFSEDCRFAVRLRLDVGEKVHVPMFTDVDFYINRNKLVYHLCILFFLFLSGKIIFPHVESNFVKINVQPYFGGIH